MSSIIRATTTSGLQVAPDNSGSLQLQTNGTTTAVTIDTSQNVGIGTASPSTKLHVNSGSSDESIRIAASSNPYVTMYRGSTWSSYIQSASTAMIIANRESTPMILATSDTERMRIDSSGNVNINRTSGGGKLNVTGDLWLYSITAGAGNSTIKYNSNTGQCTYDTSSRYHKENIHDLEYGLSSVMAMKPRKYVYKTTGVTDIGFIADEMLSLVPEITPLANNCINDMGVPDGEPFTVNYDRLTAVLVKAIQEQQTIINDLKARIETLEAK